MTQALDGMDFLYTSTLLVSLAASGIGLVIGVLATLKDSLGLTSLRAGLTATFIAALALLASVAVHWHAGHGANSAEPIGLARFAWSHPAFLVAASVAAIGAYLLLRARRRRLVG